MVEIFLTRHMIQTCMYQKGKRWHWISIVIDLGRSWGKEKIQQGASNLACIEQL